MTYQSTRTIKHVKLPQGNVRRVSVSVLLDHDLRIDKGKKILDAPSPEKLKVVKDLVGAAIGLLPDRDQLIVESFPFDATLRIEPPAVTAPPAAAGPGVWGPPWLQQLMKQKDFAVLAGIGGGVLLLLLGGIVFLLMRSRKKKSKVTVSSAPSVAGAPSAAAIGEAQPPDLQKEMENNLAEQALIKEKQTRDVLASLKLPPVTTKKTEVLVKHIGAEAKRDPAVMAQVIRTWLNSEGN